MNLLNIIRSRRTIRKFKLKRVPLNLIRKLIIAGAWAPSAHNCQSSRFAIINHKNSIRKFSKFLNMSLRKKKLYMGIMMMIKSSFDIMRMAPLLMVVYSKNNFTSKKEIFGKYYYYKKLPDIEGISASIQNILLMAHYLKLGACWLTKPLFLEKEIKSYLCVQGEIVAVLAIGYPAETPVILKRKGNNCKFIR